MGYKNKICGNCSNFYCGKCIAKEIQVDVLDCACEAHFQYFNAYNYKKNKGVI